MKGEAHLCMSHSSGCIRGGRGEGMEGREEVELSSHSSVPTLFSLPHSLRALRLTGEHPPSFTSHPLPHPSHTSKAHQTLSKTSSTLQPESHTHLTLNLPPPLLLLLTPFSSLLLLTPSPPLPLVHTTRCLQQPQSSQAELDGRGGVVEGEGNSGQREVGLHAELEGEGGGGEVLSGMADCE